MLSGGVAARHMGLPRWCQQIALLAQEVRAQVWARQRDEKEQTEIYRAWRARHQGEAG